MSKYKVLKGVYTLHGDKRKKIVSENHNDPSFIMVSGGNNETIAGRFVHCINVHDELVEALKKCAKHMKHSDLLPDSDELISEHYTIVDIAQQALKKAEGK